jgi:aldehyde:ferredoxin oxidoreductase
MAGYDGLWVEKPRSSIYHSHPSSPAHSYIFYSRCEKHPRVAVIGPAGEGKIPLGSILTDHGRLAGRTGMGAVMGSKNLKAVAVKGTGKVPVVDREKYEQIRSVTNHELKADTYSDQMHELGSAGAVDFLDYLADMPKKYFQNGEYEV